MVDLIKLANGSKANESINKVVGEWSVKKTAANVANRPIITQLLILFALGDTEKISTIIAIKIVAVNRSSGQNKDILNRLFIYSYPL